MGQAIIRSVTHTAGSSSTVLQLYLIRLLPSYSVVYIGLARQQPNPIDIHINLLNSLILIDIHINPIVLYISY